MCLQIVIWHFYPKYATVAGKYWSVLLLDRDRMLLIRAILQLGLKQDINHV